MGKSFHKAISALLLVTVMLEAPLVAWGASPTESMLENRGGGGSEFHVGQNTGINVKVTLLGGVRSQGVYHIPESTDMISLIGYAGGGNEFAKLNDITIKRRKGDSYEVLDVSLKNLATSAGSLPTPRLMNGDVVFVPESRSTQNLMLGLSIISTVLSIALAGYAVSQIKK